MAIPFPLPAKARAVVSRALSKMAKAAAPAPQKRADASDSTLDIASILHQMPGHGYEGASQSRRLSPWVPNRNHINTILSSELPLLRARTRQLVANTAHGSNASETFVSYATSTGIKPSPLIASANQKKAVSQAWNDWTDEADADGITDFYGMQSLVARSLFDAGEVFIRRRDRFASDGLTIPLQIQLLEGEQLDSYYTTVAPGSGNRIRCGIEFNPIGQRVAYWFFRQHPGDATYLFANNMERVRIPAEQIIHCYKPLRPGQIRGKPWLTAAMVTLYDFDKYTDAELTRKLGSAMFMSFITQELDGDIGDTGLVDTGTVADPDGTAAVEMEPGASVLLNKGQDVKFNQPADVGPNFEAFVYRKLLELCAAMGLPYFAVSGDTSKANYSSIRAALVECKRRIEQFQWEVMIFQMCRQVWGWWLPTAVLCGAVNLPGFATNPKAYSRVKWITPKWDWVDPLKDAQAEKLQVDAGFKARSDVIESMGEDPEDTDARIAADHAREKRLGLEFPVGFSKQADAPAGGDLSPTGGDTSEGGASSGSGSGNDNSAAGDAARAASEEAHVFRQTSGAFRQMGWRY